MLLSELLSVIDYNEIINRSGMIPESTDVISLCSDSRTVFSGSMFVCISGSLSDGHDFAWSAYDRRSVPSNCRTMLLSCWSPIPALLLPNFPPPFSAIPPGN